MTGAIIIIVCCWIVSFFFNGIESGLLAIDPVRLRRNVKRRVPAAVKLDRLLKRPERLLVTVLLSFYLAGTIARPIDARTPSTSKKFSVTTRSAGCSIAPPVSGMTTSGVYRLPDA